MKSNISLDVERKVALNINVAKRKNMDKVINNFGQQSSLANDECCVVQPIESRRSSKSFSTHRSRKIVGDIKSSRQKRRWSVDRSAGLNPNALVWASNINKIHLKQLLGSGGFGSVYLGVASGQIVAVKRFHIRNGKAKEESFLAECQAVQLKHPNIIEVLAATPFQKPFFSRLKSREALSPIPQSPSSSDSPEIKFSKSRNSQLNNENALIVMEYAGGKNLQTLLSDEREIISFERKIRFCQDIANAMIYIHDSGIIHLDLKPSNVVVTSGDRCKLGDFGCCKAVKSCTNTIAQCKRSTYLTGTIAYRAPELFKNKTPTTKADIYSFGITIWQICSRKIPYSGKNLHEIIFKVVSSNLRPDDVDDVTDGPTVDSKDTSFKELYESAWHADPNKRPSARETKLFLDNLEKL